MIRLLLFSLFIIIFNFSSVTAQSILINEIMASNRTTVEDEDGDFEDWIELKNTGDEPIDLTGFGLSDNDNNPFKWVFPSGVIEPQGYIFVWASGKDKSGVNPDWQEIFPYESEWRYYDRASSPPSDWKNIDFDDNNWDLGTGLFGYGRDYLGYGTVLDYGGDPSNKHISYYFRKNFTIKNLSENTFLRFRFKVDDGAVVYLNGEEIDRFHMPEGEIGHSTRATDVVGIYEVADFYATSDLIREGVNTVAVSVHQNNRHSSDVAFDMRLDWSVPAFHTNFSISSAGEEILISNPDGELLDRFAPVVIPTDISYGRKRNQSDQLVWFDQPTPNRPNSEVSFEGITPAPVFSRTSGFYTSDFDLEIEALHPDSEIYYTLDGSVPKEDRLAGKVYPYKNNYQQHPNSDPGEFLFDTLFTLKYEQPLFISDRTNDDNKTSQKSSTWFRNPHYLPDFPIFKGTVVRAVAVRDGFLPSDVVTKTFFVNPEGRSRFNLPVISLAVDENHLFDFYEGIYTAGIDFENWRSINSDIGLGGGGYPANWRRTDEFPLHFQYFSSEEEFPILSQQVGFRIHGGWSRARRIKSLRLYARNSYERPGELNYPFLKDNQTVTGEAVNDYKRLLLRAGGNDNNFVHDALKHRIMAPAQLDIQTAQPAINFINGEYWGLVNIRERIDRFFIASRYGIDPDNIIMLREPWGQGVPSMVQEGKPDDILLFRDYFNFLLENDVRKDEIYEEVKNFKDVLGYIDYNLMFIYLNNSDWGGWKHYRYWRVRETGAAPHEDGRWRFIIWDFDAPRPPEFDMLEQFLDPQGNGLVWETNFILRKLMENTEFKNLFVNRLADHINTTFQPHRVERLLNELIAEIEPESQEHFERWRHPAFPSAEANYFMDYAERRPDIMRDQLREHLQTGEDRAVNLNVSDDEMGFIRLNTIDLIEETEGINAPVYPWEGIYLSEVPIELEAIPYEGFEFSHWEGLPDSLSAKQTVSLESALSATAHFYSTGRPEAEIIYYWVFDNDLPNNTPLTYVESTYAKGNFAEINYQSCLAGYPFSSGHPSWRKASMERRNRPTALNYFPEANNGREFENANMRGLQIKQPFEGNAGVNQMSIEFSTEGFRNIEVALAVMDEYAVEALVIDWEKQNAAGTWEVVNISADTFYVSDSYLLYQRDLSRVEEINDLEAVRMNINFIIADPTIDEGDRVTFNNISILGYPIDENLPGIDSELIPDLHIVEDRGLKTIHLSNYFQTEGDQRINFEVIADRDFIAELEQDHDRLFINPLQTGAFNVIVQAYDWLTPQRVDTFTVIVHPKAVITENGEYFFGKWGSDRAYMEYPEGMLFIEYSSPLEASNNEKAYPNQYFPYESFLPYELISTNAIRGLENDGLSFLIEEDSYSGVLLALNTIGANNLSMTFVAEKLMHGGQMQMFYRTDVGAELNPLIIEDKPVIYRPNDFETGEKVHFFQLPSSLIGQEYLQLIWLFSNNSEDTNHEFAEMRLDNIYIFPTEDEESGSCLRLFPNPAKDQVFFYTNERRTVQIIDSKGSVIRQFESITGIQSVNLSELHAGVYLLKLVGGDSKCVQQFIKY